MELPFAGLHQLCAPMLDRLDALPEPQQVALRVALGLASGDAPDRFLVALAALSLLAEVAAERPLLCFVDDAQWLDAASAPGPRLRRAPAAGGVGGDRVRRARRRPTSASWSGLPELPLEGLDDEDARALLATVIPGRLDERVRDRIVAETRGNPLALLELPRGLSAAQLAGGFGLPEPLPLSGRIEESFLRRLEELPDETRLLLLVAAAEPVGDPALMWRAATRLGVAGTALEPAARTGLLDVGAQVRFRHPLVRSAVYRSASDPERQSVHGALAEVTDAALEPDRRAWHRAQATHGPGRGRRGRARALGGPGAGPRRARRRGGVPGAGGRPDGRARPPRRAHAGGRAGQPAGRRVRRGARAAGGGARPARSTSSGAPAWICCAPRSPIAQNRGSDAPLLLLRAARTLETLDVRLSRDTYLDAWSAALFAGRLATRRRPARRLPGRQRPPPDRRSPPRPSDLLLDGFALVFTDGRARRGAGAAARGHRVRR